MCMTFNEQNTVEKPIIAFLKEKLGFEYREPADFSELRDSENEYIITSLLEESLVALNPGIDEDTVASVVREVKRIGTDTDFLDKLRNGVLITRPGAEQAQTYKLLDFENPESNSFVVTNQFYFQGNSNNIRPDVVIFVNGLPLVIIEAKSPTASEGVSFRDGIDQIKRYEKDAPNLFLPNCFNIATDGINTVYGATGAPPKYFLQWRDDKLSEELGGDLEMSLCVLLKKEHFLDIVQNFILFERSQDGVLVKKIARYQQVRATNKMVDRVVSGEKRKGLIWHTQGSGKTFTMFFTAWKLRFHPALNNPKVFVIIDRIDLDNQMYDAFIGVGGQNIIRVKSGEDLANKIQSPERGIFITTLQKFKELDEHVQNLDNNVVVLSDEAHRGDEGITGINVRNAFPNAFFFGFTGTPIDKKNRNTFRNYEGGDRRYLDYYSIQQAIDDGVTVSVTYEARLSKFFVDKERLEEEFLYITDDLSEKERDALTEKYARIGEFVKKPERMKTIARDIVEHYRSYIEPSGFKAQIVAYDREAVAEYKELLDKMIPSEHSAVVLSFYTGNSEALREYNIGKREQEKIIEEFKDPNSQLKFLIVCDMLLTGFDAPIEQVMYLDRPLRDHALLQAIARTNRVYKNKEAGKVIDYFGITNNLSKALNFDEEVIETALVDIGVKKGEFVTVFNEVMNIFEGVDMKDPSIENLRKCLSGFIDNNEKREHFRGAFARLKNLFEFLSPDPFLKKYMQQFEWVVKFHIAFLKKFNDSPDWRVLKEYGEKIQRFIRESGVIDYEGLIKNSNEISIGEMVAGEQPDGADLIEEAFGLKASITKLISPYADSNPAYQKFSERLLAIQRDFNSRQISLLDRVREYRQLRKDIQEEQERVKKIGLSMKEHGLLMSLQEFVSDTDEEVLIAFVKDLYARIEQILDPGWEKSIRRDEFTRTIKQTAQGIILEEYKGILTPSDLPKFLNRLVDIMQDR